jgi:hypothetical protein
MRAGEISSGTTVTEAWKAASTTTQVFMVVLSQWG